MDLIGHGHAFIIEMKSRKDVKTISFSDEAHDRVLFEGNLGELEELSFVEGDVLEFIGENGVLRIYLQEEQLRNILTGLTFSAEKGRSKNT